MVTEIWKCANVDLKAPFPWMTFNEAMDRFGVDKPDTRYGLEIQDVSDLVQNSSFGPFQTALTSKGGVVRAINVKKLASSGFSRREITDLDAMSKRLSVDGSGVFVVKMEVTTQCELVVYLLVLPHVHRTMNGNLHWRKN